MTYIFHDNTKSPVDLLKIASRFRQQALYFSNDPMEAGLEKYADELESRARQIAKRMRTDVTAAYWLSGKQPASLELGNL
jgi:hypothetical protein